MLIIPVLDVKDGQVVRAQMGMRDTYRPIETPLSETPAIMSVADGLRRIHPFSIFYVADLDAIESGSGHFSAAAPLSLLQPRPQVWLDAGFRSATDVGQALADAQIFAVLGSESQAGTDVLSAFGAHPRLILSLDFHGDAFLGPPAIMSTPDLWPRRVIVMTLDKVGARCGPDFDRLRSIKDIAGNRDIIAAGGIRNVNDLERLSDMGIAGALVATSLHSGELTGADVAAFYGS
ncbi:phosphoribosylformimino-5-aminoimidazole carboxamide ribotide isomerase [Rhizobium mongolense subsp. loessense]|uniref:Phosphoribosylformimino-5-aminoimidazole carboxamide ribotide isomerase n=1 Tax=Rhizobium mongolense subsp. loessense TaxID=158890 RepID=A0A1G4TCQ3_9HYPH|nr:HisA/HisF-related TIM barrel protein [Rhizobium mongolense]SCW79136.1 phosphoribosylformimino-5-aminoimidazole carboxamide ribotide isomerase [Rhizobium mongolense subsp. loessense]